MDRNYPTKNKRKVPNITQADIEVAKKEYFANGGKVTKVKFDPNAGPSSGTTMGGASQCFPSIACTLKAKGSLKYHNY